MANNSENNLSLDMAMLRWMYEFGAAGLIVTDRELNIRSYNKWFAKQIGKNERDLIGQNLLEAFPELGNRGFDQYYRDAINGQSRILSHRLHKYLLAMPLIVSVGTLTKMQQKARIFPLYEGERVIGTITVIEDVTERVIREMELNVQIEERERLLVSELAARQLAEENSRLKDQFLATVSHEIRTPLNAINGWTQILLKGKLDGKETRQALDTIQKSVISQTQIIEDLLDISRIITGQMRLELLPVNLTESINSAIEVVRPAATAKEIRLIETFESKVQLIVGDGSRLQQIFWNLLSNAIKFTPFNGQVEIILREIGENAEVVIRDTGQGISADFIPFVFERFRQADGSMKRKYGGLGLGLSIVKNLLEMHGGTIRAESPGENKGSTFTILLPLLRSSKKELPDENLEIPVAQTLPRNISGARILIVDDEADSRELLKFVLEDNEAEVLPAANAIEALEKFSAFKPDILISDLGMPGMDGYELIKEIRELSAEEGGRIPAIVLTGYVSVEEQKRVLSAGFNVHIPKPVDISEFVKIVNNLLRKKN